MKRIGTALLALGLVAMTGCKSQAYNNGIFARAASLQTSPDYVIGEGDNLTIMVLGEEGLETTNRVRPDGKMTFPGHGDIVVTGKTTEQVKSELEESFRASLGLKNPRVYVAVNSFDSKAVTVLGEVAVSGRFPYTGQMRVADLMGLARGQTIYASSNRALLFREVDGATKIYHVELKKFFSEGDFSTNFFLRPGDILYVPTNGFRVVGNQIRTWLDPFAAMFDTVGLGNSTVSYFVAP
ncbi:MAG TPA: polysaccharide biosynthesis/export family protein [Planctomycetota bacterium]|nr:polysaccharide biosynthesis/export family protein [Planctomycetota bacterium]